MDESVTVKVEDVICKECNTSIFLDLNCPHWEDKYITIRKEE